MTGDLPAKARTLSSDSDVLLAEAQATQSKLQRGIGVRGSGYIRELNDTLGEGEASGRERPSGIPAQGRMVNPGLCRLGVLPSIPRELT